MRSCNAPRRIFLVLATAMCCIALFASSANADDGTTTPRAIPAARAMPRSFSSYDELVAYASTLAADQSALDQKLIDTRTQLDQAVATIGALNAEEPTRGGALFDTEIEGQAREAHAEAARLSAKAVSLQRTAQQLSAAGALTAPATAAWRMPTVGQITQPFGPTALGVEPARVYNGTSYAHFHDGVDIAGVWAADIVAPARGRVVFVGRMMDGAEVVVIAHDGGLVSMYAHLDDALHPPTVKAGDELAAGQKIGTVGATGIVTGAHLHWGVWRNGQLIDPMSLVSK
ncbi:MAG TPA: M23 family metallopeptidase [Candidatus Acidoferrales bacterium]|nr:M23 family metallopeptidase [Candidatus Acidoferrales bacterium]